ncbi:MAG: aminopeptidase P family protein [Armatimonadetes bacterium]|nr:aminopeptidase P family protein [Armatimonadota bacterium]
MALDRVTALWERAAARGVDGVVITRAENRRHLTGFTGSDGIALVTADEALLIVDFRYVEQAGTQALGFTVVRTGNQRPLEALAALVPARRLQRLGFEADGLSFGQHRRLAAQADGTEMVPLEDLDHLRWLKDAEEIARIARAAQIAAHAFEALLPRVAPGVPERDLALELEFDMRRRGAERAAFDTIVASGWRAALPHGQASDKVLQPGEMVVIDFGAVCEGYCSDCTRTVVLGRADARQREIYDLVRRAQEAGLAALRPGLRGREVDAAAREVIAGAGHGDAFGHSLGHGVGLAVHEGPTLSPREDAAIAAGHVVTVEPGIYLPGWGGVRIEDLVQVTPDGVRVLTPTGRELREMG